MTHEGLRYNIGKTRFDLLEPYAIEQLAKVFTIGASKYEDNNWLKGMSWKSVIASLKRHLSEFEKGVDYDDETKQLHMAHVAWNAMCLTSFYKHYPQGDDRWKRKELKIGLDIDEVLCDFLPDWCAYWKQDLPDTWWFDRHITDKFQQMRDDNTLNEFYMRLKPLTKPSEIPFEPHCYVTSRPVPVEVTEAWLDKNGYPRRPVICVGIGQSKVQALKEAGVDIFVDDRYDNFTQLNDAGICTYLFDACHNQRHNVGYRRIKSLKELL